MNLYRKIKTAFLSWALKRKTEIVKKRMQDMVLAVLRLPSDRARATIIQLRPVIKREFGDNNPVLDALDSCMTLHTTSMTSITKPPDFDGPVLLKGISAYGTSWLSLPEWDVAAMVRIASKYGIMFTEYAPLPKEFEKLQTPE